MWVKFLKNYPFKPKSTVTIDYRAGMVDNLPKATAERLIAEGKAEAVTESGRPKKALAK